MQGQDSSITSLPRPHALGLADPHARPSGLAHRCEVYQRRLGILLWSGLVGLVLALSAE